MRQAAEEGNAFAYEHGDTRDDEAVNQSGAQELLNRDSAVDVEVVDTTGSELRNDLCRGAGHLFDQASTGCGEVSDAPTQGSTAQDDYALIAIWPGPKRQNRLEGVAAHHDGIDASYKFVLAMGFPAACRQEVEAAVWPRNEAVEAGADKD
jgi:hypothetical protein